MDEQTQATSLDLDRHLAAAGSAAASFARLWQSLWVQPYVNATLLEMCRLTLARLHRDEHELRALNPHVTAGAVPAGQRQALIEGTVHRSALFADAEQVVLDFTESYGLDPQSIEDASADAVKAHLGEAGLVFLIEALGLIDGRIRTARCLRDLARSGASGKDADV